MKKRLLSLVLVLAMVLSVSSVALAVNVADAAAFVTAAAGTEDITLTANVEFTSDATIVLNCDVNAGEHTITIAKGANVTLDLAGHTISGVQATEVTANDELIENKGTLTISDSDGNGKITYKYTYGTTDCSVSTISNDCGTLTVYSGLIENTTPDNNSNNFAIDSLTNATNGAATVTINGGTIKCDTFRSIRQFANSTTDMNSLTINNGTMIGQVWTQNPSAKDNLASLLIVDGSFEPSGRDGSSVFIGNTPLGGNYASEDFSVSIQGGDYETKVGAGDAAEISGVVSGGTFGVAPAADLIADDAIAAEISGENGFVAYAVGKEAIEKAAAKHAAEEGGTIVKVTQASNTNNSLELPGGTTVKNATHNYGNDVDLSINGQNLPGIIPGATTTDPPELIVPKPSPTQAPVQNGKNYWVKYNGGNNFSTNKKDVPTSVEIDGMPVPFVGDGKNFTVSCILSGAERITVRWNSTSVTTNFEPDANAFCGSVDIPKTGDVSIIGYAVMAIVAVAGAMKIKK